MQLKKLCKAYNVQEGEVIVVFLLRAINHEDVVITAGNPWTGHVAKRYTGHGCLGPLQLCRDMFIL